MKIAYLLLILSLSLASMQVPPAASASGYTGSDHTDEESSDSSGFDHDYWKEKQSSSAQDPLLPKAVKLLRTSFNDENSETSGPENIDCAAYKMIIQSYKEYLEKLHMLSAKEEPKTFFESLHRFKKCKGFAWRWNDDRQTISPLINANIFTAKRAIEAVLSSPSVNDSAIENKKKYLALALENRKRFKKFNAHLLTRNPIK